MQTQTDHTMTTGSDFPARPLAQDFCVGDWLVCPDLNRLRHRQGSLQRQLEPRLIHLLSYLAANADRVLSRDELIQELWPRVIVNENSLTRAISELRKQLDLSEQPGLIYIETIPKKGYRLLQAVNSDSTVSAVNSVSTAPVDLNDVHAPQAFTYPYLLPRLTSAVTGGMAALCLSLVLGVWLGMDYAGKDVFEGANSVLLADELRVDELLADEVLRDSADYMGGEVTLSTAEEPLLRATSIETPVISKDEGQYAYIQHDRAGSTIFLGRLDALAAPVVAVYNSPDKLFNLTWSPLGNSLMFARKANISTAALFADERLSAELIMLDLTTLETHRMLQEMDPPESDSNKSRNLT